MADGFAIFAVFAAFWLLYNVLRGLDRISNQLGTLIQFEQERRAPDHYD